MRICDNCLIITSDLNYKIDYILRTNGEVEVGTDMNKIICEKILNRLKNNESLEERDITWVNEIFYLRQLNKESLAATKGTK